MTNSRTPDKAILVVYHGAPAALVGSRQLSFVGEVRHLPPADPVVRVVTHMAYYAQLVLFGQLPGPYRDHDAEQFARFALIDPAALASRTGEPDDRLAADLRIPAEQISQARQELGNDRDR